MRQLWLVDYVHGCGAAVLVVAVQQVSVYGLELRAETVEAKVNMTLAPSTAVRMRMTRPSAGRKGPKVVGTEGSEVGLKGCIVMSPRHNPPLRLKQRGCLPHLQPELLKSRRS